jgi:hypothetical protein
MFFFRHRDAPAATFRPDVGTGKMSPACVSWLRYRREFFGAGRWFSDPFAMIDVTATPQYAVAPNIQSLFQGRAMALPQISATHGSADATRSGRLFSSS